MPLGPLPADVDGTLLSSKNELTLRTQQAIEKCIELGVPVSLCAPLHAWPDVSAAPTLLGFSW